MGFALLLAVTTMAAAARAQTAYKPDATPQQVTFAKDVAPILQEHCQSCHRTGAMAPMSLVTFEETRPYAKAIKQRVETRTMPPWNPDDSGNPAFQNDPSLTDKQIDTIVQWVNAGAPQEIPRTCRLPDNGLNQWQLAKQFGQPGSGDRFGALYHACAGPGRLVEPRPPCRSPRRAGCARWRSGLYAARPQDHESRPGAAAAR